MPWRDWMEASLYDPEGGFYVRGQHPAGLGRGTHFATSPTLHPFFSQCIAREIAATWKQAGQPRTWDVVEYGAGTGTLAKDAMQELRRLQVPARWIAIDVREGPPVAGVEWSKSPPPRFDAVVANEFLDALPFDFVEWDGAQWQELGVDVAGEAFTWAQIGPTKNHLPAGAQESERRVVMPANGPWLQQIKQGGATLAVVVDYGSTKPATDVRAFKGHDFTDPLSEPGDVDLTADVDFQELGEQAVELGFRMELESQERFLLRHDIFAALNKTDRTTRHGMSDYLRLRQLVLPTGFGSAFMVARITPADRPPALH
jgi:NADH dehydrogenase [ubiquinone] 1 alpha subcomplex assembly factor 7